MSCLGCRSATEHATRLANSARMLTGETLGDPGVSHVGCNIPAGSSFLVDKQSNMSTIENASRIVHESAPQPSDAFLRPMGLDVA